MPLTSVIRYVRAADTSSTTGAGKTGLAHSDITAKYVKPGGTLTTLTTETITTLGTYQAPTSSAHIRIKEVSSSDPAKGLYEVHFHDDTISSGSHIFLLLSATGALFIPLEMDLANITGRVPATLTDDGNIKADALKVNGAASAAQTGDSYAIVSSGTHGNAALKTLIDAISAKTANLPSDPADQSEIAASLTAILNAINSANYAQTRFRFSIPEGVEVPESGTADYVLGINTYNASGALTDLDSLPTLTAFYADGTSASALFGSVSNVGTGLYNVTLSIASGTVANKFVRVVGTGAMSGDNLGMTDYVWIKNDVSPDFSSSDRTKLEAIHGKLPSGDIADQSLVMLAASYTAPPSAATNASAVRTELATELARIDVANSTRASQTSVDDLQTTVDGIAVETGYLVAATGTVSDLAPTATSFKTSLTAGSSTYKDQLLHFTTGALAKQANPIRTYTQTDGVGVVTFDAEDCFTAAPANGDQFAILVDHIHPVSQIAEAVAAEDMTVNTIGNAALAQLAALDTINVVGAVTGAGVVNLTQGGDYLDADGRDLQFVNAAGSLPNLTGATPCLVLKNAGTTHAAISGTVVTASGANQRVDFDVTDTTTNLLTAERGTYEVYAVLSNGSVIPIETGVLNVTLKVRS